MHKTFLYSSVEARNIDYFLLIYNKLKNIFYTNYSCVGFYKNRIKNH